MPEDTSPSFLFRGGPDVKFRVGRKDSSSVEESVEEGRHPDGDKGADHLRDVFYRMGLK